MWNGWSWVPRWTAVFWLAALSLSSVPGVSAQTNPHSQVLYLPDPTPRPKDPDLTYGHNPDDGPRVNNKAIEDINTKRRALVTWAANELVRLSDQMEAEVRQPQSAASVAAAKGNAEKIEKLARNLSEALKAR